MSGPARDGRPAAGGVRFAALGVAALTAWSCAVAETPGDGAAASAGSNAYAASAEPRVATAGTREAGHYGFGSPAGAAEIAAWDIDIGPDGAGLPPGQGTVRQGLDIYATKCLACHGPTGSEGPNDLLAPRLPDDAFPFATDRSARATVGSYWPYATTLFDYTRRAMPFDRPGTLTDEEVYALVGAMLYFNDLLPEDAVVDSATVVDTHMPARDRFVRDDRTGGPEIR